MNLNKKHWDIINYLLSGICLILINIIAAQYFFRLDLTEEKRYTIAEPTKITLQNLDDIVYIEIYLDGDLPAGFKRLQRSIKEMLDEFRVYAGSNIQYKFIDPMAEKDERLREKFMMQLATKGVQPTNLFAKENGKQTENMIFPGAIISYKGREMPLLFLKGNSGASPSEILNQSVEGIEFELIAAVRKFTRENKKRVAFLEGHGELSNTSLDDIYLSLKDNYLVDRVNLSTIRQISDYFDVLIVAKPSTYFSEADKLKIDQFIIKGGKVMFLIDKLRFDAKLPEKENAATAMELNIDDMLFRYGVRLNNTIIEDLQSGAIPMVVGMVGDKPQTRLAPWRYHIIHTKFSNHPVVRNMSAVISKYTGTIDTVKAEGIRKVPLMYTSRYNKIWNAPVIISLAQAGKQPEPDDFNGSEQPVGYLLEGKFKSVYTNRLSQEKQDSIDFVSQSTVGKIIIFSDGDLISNEVTHDGQVFPLGFDRYMRKKFANKDLIENCLTYLCDESGIINIRSKEVKLRPLDKLRVKKERTQWQIINVLIPVVLVVAFGLGKAYFRNRRYGGK